MHFIQLWTESHWKLDLITIQKFAEKLKLWFTWKNNRKIYSVNKMIE